jgi:hypothetical protein
MVSVLLASIPMAAVAGLLLVLYFLFTSTASPA